MALMKCLTMMGPTALMNIVEDIKGLPNIKVRFARPEPYFLARLGNHPHLKLQDLTAGDMRVYASKRLRLFWEVPHHSIGLKSKILSQPIDKAEGVFLWLQLVIHSLLRGLENGDSADELLQRIDILPNEMSKLYFDMWIRWNEDTILYRKAAARYFNRASKSQLSLSVN